MHVIVLVILCEGSATVHIHESDDAAWAALMRFVDNRWHERFAPAARPEDEQQRARAFFRDEELYLIASADLSELERWIEQRGDQ